MMISITGCKMQGPIGTGIKKEQIQSLAHHNLTNMRKNNIIIIIISFVPAQTMTDKNSSLILRRSLIHSVPLYIRDSWKLPIHPLHLQMHLYHIFPPSFWFHANQLIWKNEVKVQIDVGQLAIKHTIQISFRKITTSQEKFLKIDRRII